MPNYVPFGTESIIQSYFFYVEKVFINWTFIYFMYSWAGDSEWNKLPTSRLLFISGRYRKLSPFPVSHISKEKNQHNKSKFWINFDLFISFWNKFKSFIFVFLTNLSYYYICIDDNKSVPTVYSGVLSSIQI